VKIYFFFFSFSFNFLKIPFRKTKFNKDKKNPEITRVIFKITKNPIESEKKIESNLQLNKNRMKKGVWIDSPSRFE
jgi:hypothetical protein